MMRSILGLLLLPLASHSADTIHLTGREAEAVQLATQVFKSKQGSKDQEGYPIYGDLRHYTVAD